MQLLLATVFADKDRDAQRLVRLVSSACSSSEEVEGGFQMICSKYMDLGAGATPADDATNDIWVASVEKAGIAQAAIKAALKSAAE